MRMQLYSHLTIHSGHPDMSIKFRLLRVALLALSIAAAVLVPAATARNGGKASYSNFGSDVAIAAPGGGSGDAILSTLNSGSMVPAADTYSYSQGTSMAAPHVAGVVCPMLSANSSLTPARVLTKSQPSARAFPTGTGSDCTAAVCGAGIVHAAAALGGAASPPPVVGRVDLALASNGTVPTASSTHGAGFAPTGAMTEDVAAATGGGRRLERRDCGRLA